MAVHPSDSTRRHHDHDTRSPRIRRRGAIASLVVALIFVIAVTGFLYEITQSGLVPESGVIHMPGLTAAVKVIRDSAGVPHIYAKNRLDLERALGYTQAQDRLFEMELRRRVAEGKLAEVLGPEMVESDYLYRLFDPDSFARECLAMYPPAMRAELDAFVAGINQYIDDHEEKLQPAFRLLGLVPKHFTAGDIEAGSLMLAMLLGYNATEESLYINLAPTMPPDKIAALMPVYPTLPLEPPPPAITAVFGPKKVAFELIPGLAGMAHLGLPASNNWVVDGSMSASKKPMLASDPHLPQSLPSIWYEAVLVTPDGFTSGVMATGSPAVAIGSNGHVTWGVTSVMADVMDLSLERLSPDQSSYQFQGKWYPVERRNVTIAVKGGRDVTRAILSTRHGPIVSYVLSLNENPLSGVRVHGNYALSLRFAGTAPGPSAGAGFGAATARTGKELVEAYRTFATTPLNLVWGDDSGNIGWHVAGAIPNRIGFDGKYPTPGYDGAFEWNGLIPFDKLPQSVNPPSHFIVTANNRLANVPWNASWIAPWRYERIANLLRGRTQMTAKDFEEIQRDRVSLSGLQLRDAMIQAGTGGDSDLKWALNEIRDWDGAMIGNSRAAAIVAATEAALARRAFAPMLGANFKPFMLLEDGGAYPAIEDMLVRPGDVLWPGGSGGAGRTATIRASIGDAIAMLGRRLGGDREKWQWGALTTISFTHPLGERGGMLGWYFNRGPYPTEGGRHTVNNSWYDLGDAEDPFKVVEISSCRFIADLGNPEHALAMNHTGESDHSGSRHYDDLIGPWKRGEYHSLDPDFTRAEKAAEAELDLLP
ncbi:MAG: peptidase penicillin amidase [Candidatus Binatus sp.]|nr:peptidase penicillin amidase [Candidatus Binatus sp.]